MGASRRPASLRTRTLRGMAWAYGSYVAGRVLVLVSTGLLARLLTPKEFGLVALALTFTALLDSIRDLGVTQALIVVRNEDELGQAANATFAATLAVGVLLAGGLTLGAGSVASFVHEPAVAPLLIALAMNFPLRALGATHLALALRQLDFATRTAADLADVAVRGAVGIGLALLGVGAWSLVIGYLIGSAVYSLVLWLRVPWRPGVRFGSSTLSGLLLFGGGVTAVDVVAAYISNIDNIFVGRVLGSTALGLYSLAFRLPDLLIENLAVVAGQVLFPAFTAVDPKTLGRAYLTALRATTLVVVPAAVLLGCLASPILTLAFGPQWRHAAGSMAVLCVAAAFSTVAIPSGTAYRALGKPSYILAMAIPRALLLTGMLVALAGRGNVAVAGCQAVGAGLLSVASTVVAGRLLHTGLSKILHSVWPALFAGAGMALATLLASGQVQGSWAPLVVGTAVGVPVYLALVLALDRTVFSDLLSGRARTSEASS